MANSSKPGSSVTNKIQDLFKEANQITKELVPWEEYPKYIEVNREYVDAWALRKEWHKKAEEAKKEVIAVITGKELVK